MDEWISSLYQLSCEILYKQLLIWRNGLAYDVNMLNGYIDIKYKLEEDAKLEEQ